jgi:hypothetical protein
MTEFGRGNAEAGICLLQNYCTKSIAHSVKKEATGENGLIADLGMRIYRRRAHKVLKLYQMP